MASDPTYAAFRFSLIQQINRDRLTPSDVADILAEHHDKFAHLPHAGVAGGLGILLDREIAEYRAMGDTWRELSPEFRGDMARGSL